VFLGDLADTTNRSLQIGQQATVTLNDTIDVAEQVLTAVDQGLATVQSTLGTVGGVLQSTSGLAAATGSLSATLPTSFANIDAALATVQSLGQTVDSTLTALSALPFGPNYKPSVPFPTAVANLRQALAPIRDNLTTIASIRRNCQIKPPLRLSGQDSVEAKTFDREVTALYLRRAGDPDGKLNNFERNLKEQVYFCLKAQGSCDPLAKVRARNEIVAGQYQALLYGFMAEVFDGPTTIRQRAVVVHN
jgi:hypothetical protein